MLSSPCDSWKRGESPALIWWIEFIGSIKKIFGLVVDARGGKKLDIRHGRFFFWCVCVFLFFFPSRRNVSLSLPSPIFTWKLPFQMSKEFCKWDFQTSCIHWSGIAKYDWRLERKARRRSMAKKFDSCRHKVTSVTTFLAKNGNYCRWRQTHCLRY